MSEIETPTEEFNRLERERYQQDELKKTLENVDIRLLANSYKDSLDINYVIAKLEP